MASRKNFVTSLCLFSFVFGSVFGSKQRRLEEFENIRYKLVKAVIKSKYKVIQAFSGVAVSWNERMRRISREIQKADLTEFQRVEDLKECVARMRSNCHQILAAVPNFEPAVGEEDNLERKKTLAALIEAAAEMKQEFEGTALSEPYKEYLKALKMLSVISGMTSKK